MYSGITGMEFEGHLHWLTDASVTWLVINGGPDDQQGRQAEAPADQPGPLVYFKRIGPPSSVYHFAVSFSFSEDGITRRMNPV